MEGAGTSSEGFFKVNQIDSGGLRLVYFPSPRGLYTRPTCNCPLVSANSPFPGRSLGKIFFTKILCFFFEIHLVPELLSAAVQEYQCNNGQTFQDFLFSNKKKNSTNNLIILKTTVNKMKS